MNTNTIITAAIGAFIAVLVVLSVAAPIIHAGTAETLTYTNDGVPYALIDDETHTIVVSVDDGGEYTITCDGAACETPDFSLYSAVTLVYGETGFLRLSDNGYVRLYGDYSPSVSVTAEDPATISVSSAGVSVVAGDASIELTDISVLAYISDNGEYVLSKSPCVADDTVIIGGVTQYSQTNYVSYIAYGSIDSLTVTTARSVVGENLTISNVTAAVNSSDINGDLVRIDNISFTATLSDDSTLTATYNYFIAPATIEYDNPNYIDSTVTTIAAMLPVLMIVGVMLFVVGSFISNRRA